MAGLFMRLRKSSFSSFSSSSSANSSSSLSSSSHSSQSNYASHVLCFLTALFLSLAAFAFVLQWRGGLPDPITRSDLSGSDLSPPSSDEVVGILGRSLSPAFPYFKDGKIEFGSKSGSEPGSGSGSDPLIKICITTTTSAGLEQTLPWIYFHKVIGISRFFMFVEGKAASPFASKVLESIPGVSVIHRTKELEEQHAKSRIWNESWIWDFVNRPCNHQLFLKQTLNMDVGVAMAREAGMDWIFHLDTDELIHPAGTREYSVQELFSPLSPDIDSVVFPNYESAIESDDIKEPFSEVSLFKKSSEHIAKETYRKYFEEARHGNPNYYLTYGNGKSAAHIQHNLCSNGAHRWTLLNKTLTEVIFHEAVVLHYSYSKFSDLTSRRARCNCKPTKEDVEKCFFLEFDREAFIMASNATEEEMLSWFHERVVWDDENLRFKLITAGMLTRIYSPTIIVNQLRESGVFSSVIEKAMNKQKKNISDASAHNDDDGDEGLWESYSRKFGRMFESHATTRKVLDVGETKSHVVLPQSISPPIVGLQ